MSEARSDVVVIGAGAGGLFLAWLLARSGLSVVLVDRGRGPAPVPRGEILQPNGLALLERHGLLEEFCSLGPSRVERFRFSKTDGGGLLTVDYNLLPPPYRYGLIGLPHLLQELLLRKLRELPQIRIMEEATFVGIERGAGGIRVLVARQGRQETLAALLVVGSDGARSAVRRALGIPVRFHEYRDGYLTLVLPRPPGFGSDARYYLGRGQILGLFPLSKDQIYLFYLIPAKDQARIMKEGLEKFKSLLRAIDDSLGSGLEAVQSFDQVAFMPCVRVQAERWVEDRAALIGDAVHAMNPHVAQGTNQTLEDVSVLHRVIVDCAGRGIFDRQALSPYEELRRPPAAALQRLGDELTLLWNSGALPLVWLRNHILRTVDRNEPLRLKMLSCVAGLKIERYSWSERLGALGL